MNCDTGQITQFENEEMMKAFIDKIPLVERPVFGFTELGNMPVQGCARCKGTGIKQITPSGRRIPCDCTNPR